MAKQSDFPFLKICAPKSMIGYHEAAKVQAIKKVTLLMHCFSLCCFFSVSFSRFHFMCNLPFSLPCLNVIGCSRNEMVAVHLTTAYCLPALLYGCESWSLRHELKPMTVAWNNTFRKIFNCCWQENPRILLYYCNSLPLAYLIDQRRLLFCKHLYHNGNSFLYSLASCNMTALAAKYDIL